jgi:hypothetical protein
LKHSQLDNRLLGVWATITQGRFFLCGRPIGISVVM